MKLSKLLLAGAFAVSSVSAFAANVTLHYTGSTAFRNGAVNGIKDWFTSNSATGLKIVYTSGSTLTTAANQGFYGVVGGKSYLITCAWSGSVGGVNSVALKTPSQVSGFYNEANVIATGTTTGAGLVVDGTTTTSDFADGAFADCSQVESGLTAPATYNLVTSEPVGVIPFVWIRGKNANGTEQGALNNVTNVTSLQARSMLSGFCPLSLLTKNPADAGTFINVLGRDNQSGTRVNTFIETGFGRDADPIQYIADPVPPGTPNPSAYPITSVTENATPTDGYGSGGTLCTDLSRTVADNGQGMVLLGYAGISDAASKITPGNFNVTTGVFSGPNAAQILAFNGVPYSHDAVKNGAYSFWNYENVLRRPGLTGDALTAYNGIRDKIKTADAGTAGVKLGDMLVGRDGAGKLIL